MNVDEHRCFRKWMYQKEKIVVRHPARAGLCVLISRRYAAAPLYSPLLPKLRDLRKNSFRSYMFSVVFIEPQRPPSAQRRNAKEKVVFSTFILQKASTSFIKLT